MQQYSSLEPQCATERHDDYIDEADDVDDDDDADDDDNNDDDDHHYDDDNDELRAYLEAEVLSTFCSC